MYIWCSRYRHVPNISYGKEERWAPWCCLASFSVSHTGFIHANSFIFLRCGSNIFTQNALMPFLGLKNPFNLVLSLKNILGFHLPEKKSFILTWLWISATVNTWSSTSCKWVRCCYSMEKWEAKCINHANWVCSQLDCGRHRAVLPANC